MQCPVWSAFVRRYILARASPRLESVALATGDVLIVEPPSPERRFVGVVVVSSSQGSFVAMPRRYRMSALASVSHFEVDSAFLLVKLGDFCALMPAATLVSVRRAYSGRRARDVVTTLDAMRLSAPDTRGRTLDSLDGDDSAYARALVGALSSSAFALRLVAPDGLAWPRRRPRVDDWLDGGSLEHALSLECSLLTRV